METFMRTMIELKTNSKALEALTFTNNKNQQYDGTDCLQSMADDIQLLNNPNAKAKAK